MQTSMKLFAILAVALCAVVLITDAHRREEEEDEERHHERNPQGQPCQRRRENETATFHLKGQNVTCICHRRQGRPVVFRWNCTFPNNTTNGTTTTTAVPITTTTTAPTTTGPSTTTVAGG